MKFSKIKLQMVKEKDFTYNSRKIKSTQDMVEYINEIEQLDLATEEIAILICLNTKNQIVAYSQIAKGGINYCQIDLATIFKTVFLSNSQKFILVHNHPSGNANPSNEDLRITERICEASDILNLELLDHIVISGNDYSSCLS